MKREVTILFPGGFKPMHIGHIELIKRYIEHPNVKEIKVLIGPGIRNGITQNISLQIAEELLSLYNNISIEVVNWPTPVTSCYKFIETAKPGTYAMAASEKEDDYKKVLKFFTNFSDKKYAKPNGVNIILLPINVTPLIYKNRTDDKNNQSISSTILRNDVLNNDYNNFKSNYPGYDNNIILNIWNIIKNVII
ncbi:hypothetical protein M0Q50_09700 [bacterium]|jgi:hypothetical protein|nr:hypothetical protein [bacterium]